MKTIQNQLLGILCGGLAIATALTAWSQIAPIVTIAPTGTNQLSITVTNDIPGTGSYEVWTTPVLGDVTDYPWRGAAMGTNDQTNFVVNMPPYPSGFYEVILDTNVPPLWEAANPDNPGLGVLSITIDSPTNGMTLQ